MTKPNTNQDWEHKKRQILEQMEHAISNKGQTVQRASKMQKLYTTYNTVIDSAYEQNTQKSYNDQENTPPYNEQNKPIPNSIREKLATLLSELLIDSRYANIKNSETNLKHANWLAAIATGGLATNLIRTELILKLGGYYLLTLFMIITMLFFSALIISHCIWVNHKEYAEINSLICTYIRRQLALIYCSPKTINSSNVFQKINGFAFLSSDERTFCSFLEIFQHRLGQQQYWRTRLQFIMIVAGFIMLFFLILATYTLN